MTPLDEYAARKRDREATVAARERTHIYLGNAKVAIFVATLIYTAVRLGDLSSTVYGVAAALFVALSIWHELVMRALARAQAAVAFYGAGEDRIHDRWMREEPSGERFRDRDHPYADDLDVFGPRSLFQLLSACRTPMGEARLAQLAVASLADAGGPRPPGTDRGTAPARRFARTNRGGQRRAPAFHPARSADRLGRGAAIVAADPLRDRRDGAAVARARWPTR